MPRQITLLPDSERDTDGDMYWEMGDEGNGRDTDTITKVDSTTAPIQNSFAERLKVALLSRRWRTKGPVMWRLPSVTTVNGWWTTQRHNAV